MLLQFSFFCVLSCACAFSKFYFVVCRLTTTTAASFSHISKKYLCSAQRAAPILAQKAITLNNHARRFAAAAVGIVSKNFHNAKIQKKNNIQYIAAQKWYDF